MTAMWFSGLGVNGANAVWMVELDDLKASSNLKNSMTLWILYDSVDNQT